jgi:glycosyl transferase family 4
MRPLSVLLTNNALNLRAGSETYIRDVAIALLRRGHRPVAFSTVLGDVAAELHAATVPVLDDLTQLGEPPDIIHGHHHVETLIAALTFPNVPIVNFCHGWLPWEEMPLHHPSVRRYVAVDEVCVDRLVRVEGVARDRIDLLLNFVDLDRFRPRAPLPARPARALVLSNGATPGNYARAIAVACENAGIALDIVGRATGNATTAPEEMLSTYDLVFAKARTALEALAVGCATVLTDVVGAGPLVTAENYASLRIRNFGIRELQHAHDPAWYAEQIARYDVAAAAAVSARVRIDADMEPAIDRLIEIYGSAIATPAGAGDPSRAAAIHCTRIAGPMKEAPTLRTRLDDALHDLAVAQGEADSLRATLETVTRAASTARAELVETQSELAAAQVEVGDLQRRLATATTNLTARDEQLRTTARDLAQARTVAVQASASAAQASTAAEELRHEVTAFKSLRILKLRDAVLRIPVVGWLLRSGTRGRSN